MPSHTNVLICPYVRILNASLKHLIPNGISTMVIQRTKPRQPIIKARGNRINNQIAAESSAPVM